MRLTDEQVEQRVAELLEQMTLEEKAAQLCSAFPTANIRLGIPHMNIGEALHGVYLDDATSFPQAIAQGAMWDDGLVKEMGKIVAAEGRAMGMHHVFSPMLGLARDPRWGRVEESYGEDPYHVARLGVAFVSGIQGEGDERLGPNHMVCAPKHFVADGDSLRGSNGDTVEISETTLRETHMVPFEAVVKEAHAGSLMPASHSLNRVPCHADKWLLDDVLRGEWGFDGFTISDNIDLVKIYRLDDVEGHYLAESSVAASRMALEAGVDSELAMGPPWDHERRTYGGQLARAVEEGEVPVELVDRSVRRVLRAKFLLGLFDEPMPEEGYEVPEGNTTVADPWAEAVRVGKPVGCKNQPRSGWEQVVRRKAHEELSLKMAQKCVTLLKNEDDLLPLDKTAARKIAVIGPNADEEIRGNYSAKARYFVSVLKGIKDHVGAEVEVSYAKGCDLMPSNEDNIPAAVELAQESDLSIVVVGTSQKTMFENHDRSILELTGRQEELVKAIHATGKPMIVVLINGGALAIPWIKENVPAIVEGWYAGQDTGTALAQVLFGDVNPGGKLPVTFPYSTGMVPCYYNAMPTAGPQKYNEGKFRVCYPFGFGLSYTTFELSDPALDGEDLTVSVTNTGDRMGDQVVQLYVKRKNAARVRPHKELKGFKRVTLEPDESAEVALPVGFEQLKTWVNNQWTLEKGNYTLMVGFNSVEGNEIDLLIR